MSDVLAYAPWKETTTGHWQKLGDCFYRKCINGNKNFYVEFIWRSKNETYWSITERFPSVLHKNKYESKEAAMVAVDEIIIERGYKILTQEQFNNLTVLK